MDDIAHGGNKIVEVITDAEIMAANDLMYLLSFLPGLSTLRPLTLKTFKQRVQELHDAELQKHAQWVADKQKHDDALKIDPNSFKALSMEDWMKSRGFHHLSPDQADYSKAEARLAELYAAYEQQLAVDYAMYLRNLAWNEPEPKITDIPSEVKPITWDDAALMALITFLLLQHPEVVPMGISAVGDVLNGVGQITQGIGEAIPF